MAVSLTNLRIVVYDILRESTDSTAYPYTLVDLLLSSAQQRICAGLVRNPLTGQSIRRGKYPFLYKDKYYTNVGLTTLSAATTVGATTLTVLDTTNFEISGALYINGNIITYTGKTSTTFTGCSGVLFAFASGTQVSVAFAVPTDYMYPIEVIYKWRFKLPAKKYDSIFEDLNNRKATYYGTYYDQSAFANPYIIDPFYTIKDGDYMIVFNLNSSGDEILFRYEKIPTEFVSATPTTSYATIDNDIYAKTTIPYLAVGEVLYNRGEEGRGAELINFALGQIQEMNEFYNKQTYEDINGKQVNNQKGYLNI